MEISLDFAPSEAALRSRLSPQGSLKAALIHGPLRAEISTV